MLTAEHMKELFGGQVEMLRNPQKDLAPTFKDGMETSVFMEACLVRSAELSKVC
jgi:hypothetical protein